MPAKADRLLAGRGVTLSDAAAEDLAAIAEACPAAHSTRSKLRAALRHGAQLRGRTDLPVDAIDRPEAPDRYRSAPKRWSLARAEAFESAAWGLGGSAGLAALLALHTELAPLRPGRPDEADLRDSWALLRAGDLRRLREDQADCARPGGGGDLRGHLGGHGGNRVTLAVKLAVSWQTIQPVRPPEQGFCAPPGIRTQNLRIKSPLLCH
jgi:hypothetical protein